ncbi:hypothetical protein SSPIM334S_07893 [Streptomyces spiroverticillatus]
MTLFRGTLTTQTGTRLDLTVTVHTPPQVPWPQVS